MVDPILYEFPDSFESERLLLRSPRPGDGETVHACVLDAQEYLRPWMPWAVEIPSEEGYEAFVRRRHIEFQERKELQLLIFLKETGEMIGSTGMHNLDWNVPRFEIGYWIHPDHAGQGYVTEAVEAITDFAFDQLKAERLEIRCDEENVRSAAVARRAGYVHEATLQREARHHLTNEFRNTMIFAKLRE